MNEIIDEIDNLIDDLYKLRQEGLLENGEYSLKNLAFKEFRNKGMLGDLKQMKVKLQNKEMSLEGLNEGLSDKKFRDINGGLGLVDEIYTFQELKDIWDEDHNFDPSMEEYNSFEEWVNDTIMNYMEPVDESLN